MIGLSAVSGWTCLLAGRARVGRVRRVRTLITPGSRPTRGGATLASVLSGLDRWGGREIIRFPPPIGPRATYRTIEVGDLDVVPELFDGADFEFRVGFELDLLNRGMELLRRFPFLREPAALTRLVGLASVFGTSAGACRVEAEGTLGRYAGTVVARERGHRIPAVLASIAALRILSGTWTDAHPHKWLPDFDPELEKRGLWLVEESQGGF